MKASKALKQAAKLVEEHWTKGTWQNPSKGAVCAVGAVRLIEYADSIRRKGEELLFGDLSLEDRTGGPSEQAMYNALGVTTDEVVQFNDYRGKAQANENTDIVKGEDQFGTDTYFTNAELFGRRKTEKRDVELFLLLASEATRVYEKQQAKALKAAGGETVSSGQSWGC